MFFNWLSDGKESLLKKTINPTSTVSKPRKKSMKTINLLRSNRSVITPACKVKISHGSLEANPAVAIHNGERVTADASHGYAIAEMPSPKFDIAVADHSFQ